MSECASKYNSRAEETIYILAKLLERQTAEADEAFALVNDQQREIHGLDLDLNSAAHELEVALEKIAELQDDNMQLQYQVIDAANQRDAAIKRARVWEEKLKELSNSLEGSNDFISDVADMVADEDLLALKQAFGIDDSPTFIPEYLETEADYEGAPVDTEVLYFDHEELDPRMPTYFHTRIDGGWEDNDSGIVVGSDLMAPYARKVLQWGSR